MADAEQIAVFRPIAATVSRTPPRVRPATMERMMEVTVLVCRAASLRRIVVTVRLTQILANNATKGRRIK